VNSMVVAKKINGACYVNTSGNQFNIILCIKITVISWFPHLISLCLTEFWEMDPNYTFIFDYISHYHMNSIMLSKIFLNFVLGDFKTEFI